MQFKNVKIIKCSRFKFAQYISHKDLLSFLVASLYSNSFNSKSEYCSFFITLGYFGLNLVLLSIFNLLELLKLKLNIIFFLLLEPEYIFNESLELGKLTSLSTLLTFVFISFFLIILLFNWRIK